MLTADVLATIVVLGIACWRLARIIPDDTIADPIRRRIERWVYPDDPIPLEDGARRQWVGKLLSCQVCSGWWIAALIVVFWSLVVVDHWLGWAFLIWWPAVAGVSALASLYDTGDDGPADDGPDAG